MRIATVSSLLLLVSCTRETVDDSCAGVSMHVGELVQRATAAPDGLGTGMARMLEAMPERVAVRCREEVWTPAVRRCFLDSKTLAQVLQNRCDPLQPKPSAAPTAPPSPEPSDGRVRP